MKLKLLVGDSKAQKLQGTAEAVRLGSLGSIALFSVSSTVSTEISTWLSSIPGIDRTIISGTATSRVLSGPSFSTNFLRTRPTSDARTKMMVKLIKGLSVC